MTPEQKRQQMMMLALQQQANQFPSVNPPPQGSGQMSPATIGGTTTPYVDGAANRDFDGRQAMIAQQLRQGNDNLMSEGPQMKQMGNVAVAPTWSENAASGARKLLGGYQMGQARKAEDQLGVDREETAQAVGLKQAIERKQAEEQLQVENDRAAATAVRDQNKIDNQVEQFGKTEASRIAAASVLAGAKAGERETETYHLGDGVINVKKNDEGKYEFLNGTPTPEGFVDNLTPYSSGATASKPLTKAQMEAADAAKAGDSQRETAGRAVRNTLRAGEDVLYGGTGVNPASLLGRYNVVGGDIGEEIQDFQRNLKQLKFEGVSSTLKMLDLKPITEGEYKEGALGNVDTITSPYGLVSSIADSQIPFYRSRYNDAIKDGSATVEDRDAFINQLEEDTVYGAITPNPEGGFTFPLEQLAMKGVDVQGVEDRLKQKLASGEATKEDKEFLKMYLTAKLSK
jgi:hypothetical protein